ncbi:peptidoglycan DD-metalloendopeptidase family protein [Altererythrobacter luteolus]|uniref:Peptidoglycan DD-metalloendopeptidase family protein n=1 Tax=Pontixanthobacter luteolus TaxID=295089 RepID=A0A6I4V1C0_9SPHN|nr:M23 family metallopeptidase [Pontixanthobacter luteolus]MXP47753.1 peptidoglycan DD-metalloendopeptidase family protein [Pontixanthobacter luteolus]
MVAFSFKRSFAALALAVAGIAASPAHANSSAASADISAPVRDAQSTTLGGGDQQFKKLFASWESLDGDTATAPAPAATVSIPSRMPLAKANLTSNYGMRTHPVIGGRRAHKGVDLAAPTGTPIYATADGIVSKAERFSSYGLFVSIEHGAKLQTRFAHMSRIAVADGERVSKGDIIGYVGSTGRSTGPHLHYEVRIAGQAVNPIPYMVETEAQQAYALAMGEGGRGGE